MQRDQRGLHDRTDCPTSRHLQLPDDRWRRPMARARRPRIARHSRTIARRPPRRLVRTSAPIRLPVRSIPNSGACNFKNTAGTTLGPCTTAANCQAKPNVCNNPRQPGLPGGVSDCTQGTCNYQDNASVANGPCAVVGDCQAKPNTCTNAGATFGTACATAAAMYRQRTRARTPAPPMAIVHDRSPACNVGGIMHDGQCRRACTTNGVDSSMRAGHRRVHVGRSGEDRPALHHRHVGTACTKHGACSTGNVGDTCPANGARVECGTRPEPVRPATSAAPAAAAAPPMWRAKRTAPARPATSAPFVPATAARTARARRSVSARPATRRRLHQQQCER